VNAVKTHPADGSPYVAYLYSYPHKTAYRPLDPPAPLETVWGAERKESLFLYVHIPFCEMRCGFCNLFTTARPKNEMVSAYLSTLERQARLVRAAIGGGARFARFAIGGGTPTLLDEGDLARVLDLAANVMGADLEKIPISVETSPETATAAKIRLLVERGVDRISIGVQSFAEDENASVGRPQSTAEVERALDVIRSAGTAVLNVDLMYGLGGQTPERWLASLESALRFRPEEIYLYPLYVRPLTGLGRSSRRWDDDRVALYRMGRDFLVGHGYEQVSMRMFRRPGESTDGPVYCCQEDGMVGLGCGARSYTERLHYASAYAVGVRGVREILERWIARPDGELAVADYGFRLDDDERRRRYTILSLLAATEGLDRDAYTQRFGADPLAHFPELATLESRGLAQRDGARIVLTPSGIERSDAIGPWLHSGRTDELMEQYELR
jgi:oxygen-independent coproporphyrinogen-3 oxidase